MEAQESDDAGSAKLPRYVPEALVDFRHRSSQKRNLEGIQAAWRGGSSGLARSF
jgi:hypothetical protein